MDKAQIIAEVKSLLLKSNSQEALSKLYTFLESDDQYEVLAIEALQLKSQLSKLQKDESLGLVNYDNAQLGYNRIGNGLARLCDRLEKGELKDPQIKARQKKGLFIGATLGVLLILAWVIFKEAIFPPVPVTPPETTNTCPDFDKNSQFNILLLPFLPFRGEKVPNFEEAYRQRLNSYKKRLSFTTDTKIYQPGENEEVKPASGEEAEKYAGACDDTVRLIIWGNYENLVSNQIITTTYYKFLNVGDHFVFSQINIDENLESVTLNSISSIVTEGVATADIEQLLLGIAAQQMGDPKAAVTLLANITPPDSSTLLLWGMALADSYLEQGQNEEAIKSYDKVLSIHPDYRFALINRAMLNYENGKAAEAVEDLDRQIKNDPKDHAARLSRATIYVKEDQLDKAQKDISVLESADTERKKVIPLKKDYDQKVTTEIQRKKDAEEKLKQDPNNLQALNVLSESSIRLGEYNTALNANQKITNINPENKEAWAKIMYISHELNLDYKKVIEKANEAGVTNEQLRTFTPKIYQSKTLEFKKINQ